MKLTHSQQLAADFRPMILGCGLFLCPRRPRGKCVECWATGKSRKTRKACTCSADTTAACDGGMHIAPGYKHVASKPTPFQVFSINRGTNRVSAGFKPRWK